MHRVLGWIRSILVMWLVVAGFAAVTATPAFAAQIDCGESASVATPVASPVASPYADAVFPEGGGDLTVFAAASLVDAFAEIEEQLEAANPGLNIAVETAGSQTLVTQLIEGAEADVLATASQKTMQDAIAAGVIDGEPVTFTGNRLVIVTPPDNPAGIASLDDLGRDGVKLVLAGADVPVGSYSRAALCAYARSDAAPEGIADAIDGNVVSEEVDVRSVLAKVQIGEADAGIVYASDAMASDLAGTSLNVIEFPFETTASYPAAPVAGGNAELAAAFISYVLSPEGQTALNRYGFALGG
jgi:molybdate transport system substrate-binding protein